VKMTAAKRFRKIEIAGLLARYQGLQLLPSSGTTTLISERALEQDA